MFYSNWRFRLILASVIALGASSYFGYVELLYLAQGRTGQATVRQMTEVTTTRRSREVKHLQLEYVFTEPSGIQRSGRDPQPLDWKLPADGLLLVQYTPGQDGRSRIAGRANTWVLLLLPCSLGVLGFFVFRLWLEAREATRPRERVGKRRRKVREDW